MCVYEDSLTGLVNKLCQQHTEQQQRAFLSQPARSRSQIHKLLKKKTYETLFGYLIGPYRWEQPSEFVESCQEDERVLILSYIFDLRCKRKFDKANRLEELLGKLVTINKDSGDSLDSITADEASIRSVLRFLVLLADTVPEQKSNAIGYQQQLLPTKSQSDNLLPYGSLLYGDTQIFRPDHTFYMHYSGDLFATKTSFFEDSGLQLLSQSPGQSLCGKGLFNMTGFLNESHEKKEQYTLFGVDLSVDGKLALPDISNEDSGLFEIRIPSLPSSRNQTHSDIADTKLTESKSLSYLSDTTVDSSIWEEVLDYVPSKHYTWETRGQGPGVTERPYLTETGSRGLDEWYNMKLKELSILCPSVIPPPRRLISQSCLVKDLINVLLGIPSTTFQFIRDHQTFEMTDGTYITGLTPESLRHISKDFIHCGTYYNRLTWFSTPPVINSFYKRGLVFQAFTGAIRKVLQHYRGALLSIPKDITLLRLQNACQKLFSQMRLLAKLCKCDKVLVFDEEDNFPIGIDLLSYVYRETLECSSTDSYPMMLSLLQMSCGPYTLFVQDWVFYGICRDIYGEFMIEIHEDYLQFRDKHYWTNGYTLKVPEISQSVPLFLSELANHIFNCGKSINLIKTACPQHFLCSLAEQDIPRISLTFSKSELNDLESQSQFYVSKMQQIARQLTLSRKEKQEQEERAKVELMQKAKQVAIQELQRLQDKLQEAKEREDKKKRKEFKFLKEQMELDLERRAGVKSEEKQADKDYIAKVTRQEEALGEEEVELEKRAREELIEYYSKLSEEAMFREQKALWKVRRAQLHQRRVDFLRYDEQVWLEEMNRAPDVQLDKDSGDLPSWAQQSDHKGPVVVGDDSLPAWAQKGVAAHDTTTEEPYKKWGLSSPPRVPSPHLVNEDVGTSTDTKDSPHTLATPSPQTAGRPSTPLRKRPPTPTFKTGIKISDKHFVTDESEESPVKTSVHVFHNIHATTESNSEQPVKSQIRKVPQQDILKETQSSEEGTKTTVKMVDNAFANKESEATDVQRPHIKPSSDMCSTTQSTTERETEFPRMKKMENSYANKQSEGSEWKIKPASSYGHVSQQSKSEEASFVPRLKPHKELHASLESDYKDFGIKPRIRMSKAMSATKESSETIQRPRVKMGVMTASTESEMVDVDGMRIEKFKLRNVHGHSSDSSVQRLLYGEKKKEEESKLTTVDEVREDSPKWLDQPESYRYQDQFEFLKKPPVVDLLSQYFVYGGLGDYGISLTSDVDVCSYMPLPEILKKSVTAPLLAQISLVNDCVVNYFMVDMEITNHFKALRRYLFMGNGDFAQILSDILLEKLASNPKPWELLNPVFLNGALNKAVKSSVFADDPYAENLTFVLKYLPKILQQNSHDTLDCLELRYKVSWPLNIVITDSHIDKYSKVFSFMLQLKRAVWVLKDVWHQLKRDALIYKAGAETQFRQLQLFRQEMQHFVKVMQGYIANQVIHVTWCEFKDALNNDVHNLDDLQRVHLDYLSQTMFRCLLVKNAGPVMKIIQGIFSNIMKFHNQLTCGQWMKNGQHLTHSNFNKMVESYKTFKEYSVFLFKVVHKLCLRGYQPHLQELLLRLNFNDYYKAN